MKKFQLMFLTLLVVSIGFLSTNVFASTYYVRLDGGTAAQCNGTSNVAYPGSGTGQSCAFNHPAWVLGTNGNSGVMAAGDTLVIHNVDPSNGGQAKYVVGYGMPNTVNANCNLYSPYDCTLNPPPSGSSPSSPTIIAGAGYNSGCANFNTRGQMAQLWGTESVKQVLNLAGRNNVIVQCLEITDHSNCGFRVGTPQCSENFNGSSNGTYARNGIFGQGGSNLTLKWLDVHGFSNRNLLMGGQNNLVLSYVNMDGGYMANWDGDVGESGNVSSFSGTILIDHVKNRFAGCSESYPRSSVFSVADYSNCTDQNDNPPGYGEGAGFYNTGGNWVITDSEFSHNTQDGLDLLYHDGTGSVTIQRSLFEGNDGNQAKITSPNIVIENSVFISNCNYLRTNNKVKNINTWTSCRAGGDNIVITPAVGGVYKISNSTLYSDGNSNLLFVNRLGTCNGTENYTFRNNIYVGNGSSALYINDLGGACASAPFNTDYSIIYNISNGTCPSGSHNRCATNPGWTSSISQTASSNVPNIALQSSSLAIGAGTLLSGISTLDFKNMDRGTSAWDIGAMQYTTSTGGSNLPMVAITGPANASTFNANSNITITASASEVNGTITSVAFYNGATLLGTSSTAPYSYTWNNVPAGSYSLTARATDALNVTATSNPVSITVNSPLQPTVSLTSPSNGTAVAVGANITLTATASEINGAIANVSFYTNGLLLGTDTSSPYSLTVNNIPVGNYTVTARATDLNGTTVTSSPVNIVVNALTAVSITSPTNLSTFGGVSNINLSANATGNVSKVEFYNGIYKLNYTGTSAPYNYTWNNVQLGTYTLTAKATDAQGVVTVSAPVTFTVTANAPTVSITSPTASSVFNAGSNITINANAASIGGTITSVSFYNGSTLLGTDSTAPYSFTWNNVAAGSYSITARATNSANVSVTSAPVAITVNSVATAPVVAITSPGNNATFTPGSNISIIATASEVGGTINRVYFYNGSTLLGSDGQGQYNYVWTNVPAGTYTLTAVATDNNGVSRTSTPITVTVAAPIVSIISPTNGTHFSNHSNITFTASSTIPSSNIASIRFYRGLTKLTPNTNSPNTWIWPNAYPGTYNLTVKYVLTNGEIKTSNPVTVIIDP